jgi:hypothetical protein
MKIFKPLLLICLLTIFACSQNKEEISISCFNQKDITTLPKYIKVKKGKVDLFADFKDIKAEGVVLYLINNSNKFIRFDHQDGDIYIKMEYKNELGEWVRAQSHISSWCGNSYGKTELLKPGYYFKFLGYSPKTGKSAEVRYKQYNNGIGLTSNNAKGVVDFGEVEIAETDSIAIANADLNRLKEIALKEMPIKSNKDDYLNPRLNAIETMYYKSFEKKDIIPILEQLSKNNDESVSECAINTLQRVNSKDLVESVSLETTEKAKEVLSKEEEDLLIKTRNSILNPKRNDIKIAHYTLRQTLEYLNKLFPSQKVKLDMDVTIRDINIDLKNATLVEALSQINNNKFFSVGESGEGFSVYDSDYGRIIQPLKGGLLTFSVSNYKIDYIEKGLFLNFNWVYGMPGLNIQNIKFKKIKILFPNKNEHQMEENDHYLPITKKDYKNYGGYIKELSGVLCLPVPTEMKFKSILFNDLLQNDSFDFFSRNWNIEMVAQTNNLYSAKIEISPLKGADSFSSEPKKTFDTGTIYFYNKKQEKLFGTYNYFSDLKSNYFMIDIPKPEYVNLQVATELEIIEIPFSFKDIKLPRSIWEQR